MRKPFLKFNIKMIVIIVTVVVFLKTNSFVYSNSVQKEYYIESVFDYTDTDKYLYLEKEDSLLERNERIINIEGYKKMARIEIAMFYDEKNGVWKNKYYNSIGLKETELFYGGNRNQVYDNINMNEYLEEMKQKVVNANYDSKEGIDLGNRFYAGSIKDYIIDGDKKLVITQIYLRYNKQLEQFCDIWAYGWFMKK